MTAEPLVTATTAGAGHGVAEATPPLDTRRAILAGFAVIAVALGGLGGWAATAPLASAVMAPAVVTVDGSRKQVQHLEGGIVSEIAVRDGARVAAGQLLLRLDETRPRASLAIVRSALDSARILEARLIAERDGTALRFPDDLLARNDEPNLAEMMRAQQVLFEARQASFAGQQSILRQRIAQSEQEIAGLQAQQTALEQQIALVEDELTGLRMLLRKGFTERTRVLALEREAARLRGSRGERIADIARTRNAIGGTRLEILQMDRTFREKVVSDIRDVQAQIADLNERLTAMKQVLDHIDIRAPAAGTVVGMAAHTVGGVIRPGDTILEIVPKGARLVIEAQIQPTDIDNVAVDQDTEVRFTAFKQRTTPTLAGRVVYVSADRLTDTRTGQPYYLARIEVPDSELRRAGSVTLLPGMPAEAMIKIADRTALDYLVRPFTEAVARAWRED